MLDMHAAPGSQNTDYHSDSDGNAYLWQNTSHQDDFVRLWKIIAQKYKNESSILGYELLNEPVAPTNSQLTSLYQRAITAIRAIDTKHIIFLDGNIYAGNFIDFNPVELGTNIVYIFHSYSSAQEAANSWQQEYLPFQNKHNVPIICNEYGGACEYGTDSLTTFFQTKNIPYAPWGYKLTYNTLNKTPFYYVGTNHPWRTQLLNKIPDEVQAKREQMKNEMLNVLNQGSLSDQCKQKLINILNDQGTLTQKEFRRVAQNYPGDAREFKNLSKQFAAIKFSYTVAAIVSIFQSKSESEKTQLMESLKTQYWEKGDANW